MDAIRQNFHTESEAGINNHIRMKFNSFYAYLSLSYYFDRQDVAQHGFHTFFKKRSQDELEDVHKLMDYQKLRGGAVAFEIIAKPAKDSWSSCLEAVESALTTEINSNLHLIKLHDSCSAKKDVHMCDWLQTNFLQPQVEAIKKLSDHVNNLKRVGRNLGEFEYDKTISDKQL